MKPHYMPLKELNEKWCNFISKSWKVKDRKQVSLALIVFQFDLFSESSHRSQCQYSLFWSCSAGGVGNFTSDFTENRNKLQVNKNCWCVRIYKIRLSRAETVNFVCTAQYGRHSSCYTKKIQESWMLHATNIAVLQSPPNKRPVHIQEKKAIWTVQFGYWSIHRKS